MPDKSNILTEIATNIQDKLKADLGESSAIDHSVTKGNNTEQVWIDLLVKYLPTRFRVASAIIIDSEGQTSKQIDCVIFDAHFTPQIIPNEASLYVPVEAVHAVFEIKQTVSKCHLSYAANNVQSVRRLKRTSINYTGDGQNRLKKPKFHILGGLLASKVYWKDGWKSIHFESALCAAQQIEHLDFIFSAQDGYVDMVKTLEPSRRRIVNPSGDQMPIGPPSGIAYGLFRLLEELTRQGTVPAIDWSEYYFNLES